MALAALLRTLGALAIVLGMLAAMLWIVRRYNLRLPGQIYSGGGAGARRLELVERLALDGKRTVALIRRDGREHLILLAPDGPLMIEQSVVRDAVDDVSDVLRAAQQAERAAAKADDTQAFRQALARVITRARVRPRYLPTALPDQIENAT